MGHTRACIQLPQPQSPNCTFCFTFWLCRVVVHLIPPSTLSCPAYRFLPRFFAFSRFRLTNQSLPASPQTLCHLGATYHANPPILSHTSLHSTSPTTATAGHRVCYDPQAKVQSQSQKFSPLLLAFLMFFSVLFFYASRRIQDGIRVQRSSMSCLGHCVNDNGNVHLFSVVLHPPHLARLPPPFPPLKTSRQGREGGRIGSLPFDAMPIPTTCPFLEP